MDSTQQVDRIAELDFDVSCQVVWGVWRNGRLSPDGERCSAVAVSDVLFVDGFGREVEKFSCARCVGVMSSQDRVIHVRTI